MIEKWDSVLKYVELCKASEVNTRTMTPEERLKYGSVNKEDNMGRTPGSKNKQKLSDTERELQEAAKPKKCRICGKAAAEGSDKCAKCASYDKPDAPAPVVPVMPTPTEQYTYTEVVARGLLSDDSPMPTLEENTPNVEVTEKPTDLVLEHLGTIRNMGDLHALTHKRADFGEPTLEDKTPKVEKARPAHDDEPAQGERCSECGEESDNLLYGMCNDCISPDMVNHPKHYNVGKFEVIDVIDDWGLGFSLGNAVKYIARCDHKANALEDLKKAAWYLNHEIQRRERANG